MSLQHRASSRIALFLSIALIGVPALAQPALQKGSSKPAVVAPTKPRPPQPTPPAQPAAQPPAAKSSDRGAPTLKVLGAASADEENARGERDELFDVRSLTKLGAKVNDASANALRLVDHPKRDELARWIEDAIRGREIDIALLGGHKYMINSCLGVKASAGKFKLVLDNPSVRFENTGLVMKFSMDRVSISGVKIRIRPNPNLLEACSFSDKFEVGGAMEDVSLTLRMDPMYDLERCRIGAWNDLNPEVRIGNLNLKPLQNDLDRMAKNMVEDGLTMSLQMSIDGFASAIGDMVFAAIDDFLEADCPTKAGDTARTVDAAGRALGGVFNSNGGSHGSTGGGAPSTGGVAANESALMSELLARIAELEARIAELEQRDSVPNDLQSALQLALMHIAGLDLGAQMSPQIEALLASVLALAIDRSGVADRHEAFAEVLRMSANVQPRTAEPAGATNAAYSVLPNAQLKGRMGRVVVAFPDAKLAAQTFIRVERDGQEVHGQYGAAAWELLPGKYVVKVTDVAVECEVRSGSDTTLRVGLFQFDGSNQTFSKIWESKNDDAKELWGKYGAYTVGLPIGTYALELGGQRETIEIRDSELTRF